MKNFTISSTILNDLIKDAGLIPPSKETLRLWRKGRIALNKTKTGVKKYPVQPKLILNVDFIEKNGVRDIPTYSEAGLNKVFELTKNLPQNKK